MKLNIEVDGASALSASLGALAEGMRARIAKALQGELSNVAGDAKALIHNRTGQLAGSIRAETAVEGEAVHGKVSANTEYAVYVEMGTGDAGQANHAGTNPNAKPMYTPGWPGMAARPYLYPAYKAREGGILAAVQEAAMGGD